MIHELRERLHGLDADILFLQEVQGLNDRHAGRYRDWPGSRSTSSSPTASGTRSRTARTPSTATAITATRCCRASRSSRRRTRTSPRIRSRRRGLLHCDVKPRAEACRSCIASTCTSACSSAAANGRCARCASASATPFRRDAPLVIAGDFNDWRHKANRALVDELGVVEVFEAVKGRAARTFPSVMPVFRLDRIYARGLKVVDAHVHYAFPAAKISDHAALAATFELPAKRA